MHPLSLGSILLVLLLISCEDGAKNKREIQAEKPPSTSKLQPNIPIDIQYYYRQAEASMETVDVVYDPILDRPQQFYGISFRKLIEQVYPWADLDSLKASYSLEFICKDGYAPLFRLDSLLKHEGFIVHSMLAENKEGRDSLPTHFQPFYLVWENARTDNGSYWPYALTELRLVDLEEEKKYLYPVKNKEVYAGLKVYKRYCLKCHSINGFGGEMGPELNYPKNILDYWQASQMYAFVKSPQSFRYDHKMPPVQKITEEEMKDLLGYFRYIGAHQRLKVDQ